MVQGRSLVVWKKAEAADRYEVLGYAAFDGKLLFAGETRDTQFALPDGNNVLLMIVVRPRCGATTGALAYVVN